MSRNVQIVLLCEDTQQETFVRRFLAGSGWSTRRVRVEMAPPARGSAEQFVRVRFPVELEAYRSRRHQVGQALVVMVDGDRAGVSARLGALDGECRSRGGVPRRNGERVAVFVPTWRIETWLAYLAGETVDEARSDYPELPCPRDCQVHVDALIAMCREGRLSEPPPPSLAAACEEYRTRLQT